MGGGLGGVALNQSNERLSASLTRFQPKIADNVKRRRVTLDWIMPKLKTYDGGLDIGVRFRYLEMADIGEAGGHAGVFNYYDELNTQPADTIKNGRETFSNLNVPIALSHEEQWENSGKNEFDRFKEKTEEAMTTMARQQNNILWGVAGGDQSKLPTSIPTWVSGSDAGTIAGLSKAANTWLYSQESNSIGDAADFLLEKMTTGYNLCVDNAPDDTDHLDAFFTQRPVFEVIQSILPAYVTYETNKDVDIGFPTLIYMGVKIRFDSTIPQPTASTYSMYGLMSKYWEMPVRTQANYKTTKFYDMLPDQAADVAQLIHAFAVVCNNPRTNWRGSGITI